MTWESSVASVIAQPFAPGIRSSAFIPICVWSSPDESPLLKAFVGQGQDQAGPVRKAVWVQERDNGPVPEGHAIAQLHGDPANCGPATLPRRIHPRARHAVELPEHNFLPARRAVSESILHEFPSILPNVGEARRSPMTLAFPTACSMRVPHMAGGGHDPGRVTIFLEMLGSSGSNVDDTAISNGARRTRDTSVPLGLATLFRGRRDRTDHASGRIPSCARPAAGNVRYRQDNR